MKNLITVSLLLILTLNGFGQNKLKSIEVKLVYEGEDFKKYHSKIQSCTPCLLTVKDSPSVALSEKVAPVKSNLKAPDKE